MTQDRNAPAHKSEGTLPKPGLDVLTIVALCGAAVALTISWANRQRVIRLEERLDGRASGIEAQVPPAERKAGDTPDQTLPAPAISSSDDADPGSQQETTPAQPGDPGIIPLAGVKPVPSRQPDSDRVYSIRTDGAPSRGPAGAPVTIVEFSDFQCSYCSKVQPTLERVFEVYGDRVRLVWKHLPLSMHLDAPTAHLASVAAAKQGRFWEFHHKLYEHQDSLKPDDLRRYALGLGLSMQRFEADLAAPDTRRVVEADMQEAVSMALTASPGFFINGRYLRGAKPFEEFAALINAELSRRGLTIPSAARVARHVN